jgi:lipopolysaccharide transport system ATP-binding protein
MRRSEIRDRFDEIVAFSGVEKFLDTPIKHYSSGMSMRLAFAVAAHLNPDIFFVDEVLAVGDLEFQRKCLGKMESVVNDGRTILFVSHQINSIRRLCNVCIWIDGGKVVMQGPTQEVIASYEAMALSRPAEEQIIDAKRRHLTRFVKWEVITGGAEEKNWLETTGQVKIRFTLICQKKLSKPLFGIALWDLNEQLIWGNATESFQIDSSGVYEIDVDLPQLPIKPGHYRWHVSLWDTGGKVDEWFAAPDLVVATMPVAHSNQNWAGVLNISSEFSIKQVSD